MGELLRQGTAPASVPATDVGASSRLRGRGTTVATAAGCVAAVIVIAAGAAAGLWFLPFVAGLVIALMARSGRAWVILLTSAVVAVAGWAVPLALLAVDKEPVVATARAVSALAGLPASAAPVVGATLIVAVIEAITGASLARAITSLYRRPT